MRPINRKSTPRVLAGAVKKKNNWELSEDLYRAPRRDEVVIDRQHPGKGYCHVVSKADIHRFLQLLPDWDELAIGLNAIVLAEGDDRTQGHHTRGVVHICAWGADLWCVFSPRFFEDHRDVLDRLGVESEALSDFRERAYERADWSTAAKLYAPYGPNCYLCKFTEHSVRAFQLLHILLHELGHHHDRITTKSKRAASRGESYAEQYALTYEAQIWDAYIREFPLY